MRLKCRNIETFGSPQLGSCKYRCAFINLVVGTLVFSTLHCGEFSLFSIFFSSRTQKTQNAHKRLKIKKVAFYVLKNHLRGKSHLFAYLRLCAFCAFAWLRFCGFCAFSAFGACKIFL